MVFILVYALKFLILGLFKNSSVVMFIALFGLNKVAWVFFTPKRIRTLNLTVMSGTFYR